MTSTFTKAIYTIMFVFVLFLAYRIITTRLRLEDEQIKFKQKPSKALVVLTILLFVMIFTIEEIFLKVMVGSIAIYFLYANLEPIIITPQLIYHNGRADEWNKLKKWAYDDVKKNLVLQFNINGKDQYRLLPVDIKEKDRIMKTIKNIKKK